jgi:hypothetical protein
VALPFPAVEGSDTSAHSVGESGAPRPTRTRADLTLDMLMRQALEVPGAASALLEAFAAQSRALRLVQEAEARGAASLPTEVRQRLAAAAAATPAWLSTAGAGVRA